ncbi:hypothetical protein [Spirulina sp. 06S082]|uniref:hypothetical protein n=1 Tax=Spirulina sp. 06S082 TaxID=3110248 RepID=UPI002B1EFFD7|nr:hypothetical protein [Spirulina sp. 06S082]MEA5469555.1 hypothetical protein [Spirulina sp. 06S082]
MKIEITGRRAEEAARSLLAIEGIEGSSETLDDPQKAEILTTIATIVAITGGAIAISEKLYQWYQKSQQEDSGKAIEQALIVTEDGRRLLLKNATIEQLKELLED